jgi:hypothetical protein
MGACGSTKTNNDRNKKTDKLTFDETAILKLKQCRDEIKNFIKRLQDQEIKAIANAKQQLKNGNRERAKNSLNLSKMYKIQADNASNRLFAIEEQTNQIEATKNQNQAFKALEEGNKALKRLQEEVKIEDIEKISEDMQDNRDKFKEVNDFFQQNGIDLIENEKEIDNELEKLMQMQAQEYKIQLPEVEKEKKIEEEASKEETNSNKKRVEMAN